MKWTKGEFPFFGGSRLNASGIRSFAPILRCAHIPSGCSLSWMRPEDTLNGHAAYPAALRLKRP